MENAECDNEADEENGESSHEVSENVKSHHRAVMYGKGQESRQNDKRRVEEQDAPIWQSLP